MPNGTSAAGWTLPPPPPVPKSVSPGAVPRKGSTHCDGWNAGAGAAAAVPVSPAPASPSVTGPWLTTLSAERFCAFSVSPHSGRGRHPLPLRNPYVGRSPVRPLQADNVVSQPPDTSSHLPRNRRGSDPMSLIDSRGLTPRWLAAEARAQRLHVGDVLLGVVVHAARLRPSRGPGSSRRSRRSRRRRSGRAGCLRYSTPAWTLSVAESGSSAAAGEVLLHVVPRAGHHLHDAARVGAGDHAVVEAALLPGDRGGERGRDAVARRRPAGRRRR